MEKLTSLDGVPKYPSSGIACLDFVEGEVLRIEIPWDSSPSFTTIWENIFLDFFSKHRRVANLSMVAW